MLTLFNNLRDAGRNKGATIACGKFTASECATAAQAADALLAALETSLSWLEAAKADEPEDYQNDDLDYAIADARAAITKARGEG